MKSNSPICPNCHRPYINQRSVTVASLWVCSTCGDTHLRLIRDLGDVPGKGSWLVTDWRQGFIKRFITKGAAREGLPSEAHDYLIWNLSKYSGIGRQKIVLDYLKRISREASVLNER